MAPDLWFSSSPILSIFLFIYLFIYVQSISLTHTLSFPPLNLSIHLIDEFISIYPFQGTQLVRVLEGLETALFKQFFSAWNETGEEGAYTPSRWIDRKMYYFEF